jgi:hypothetical protein
MNPPCILNKLKLVRASLALWGAQLWSNLWPSNKLLNASLLQVLFMPHEGCMTPLMYTKFVVGYLTDANHNIP